METQKFSDKNIVTRDLPVLLQIYFTINETCVDDKVYIIKHLYK